MIHRTICNLVTGAPVATAGFTDNRNGDIGAWLLETVAELCECDAEDVSVVESDDGDLLAVATAEGPKPVYSIRSGILC
jgi:hypothetical protein